MLDETRLVASVAATERSPLPWALGFYGLAPFSFVLLLRMILICNRSRSPASLYLSRYCIPYGSGTPRDPPAGCAKTAEAVSTFRKKNSSASFAFCSLSAVVLATVARLCYTVPR